MESPVPARIGKYRIDEVLGRGAMGVVYLGFDTIIHRQVAIKTMASLTSADAELRERFYQEARAIGNLAHHNIVVVHDLGEERGTPYIVMEYLPGTDLAGLLREGQAFSLTDRLRILQQVARALEHAHERGIVHRDVKPSNIRVLPDGGVKLMDFGIAKVGVSQMTLAGSVLGTPDYMSPEQVRGEASDARSDLFSFGIMLFEALTGRRPFTVDNAQGTLYRLVNEEAPPLQRLFDGGSVPDALASLVHRCLHKDPGGRPRDAGQVRRALRDALREVAGPDAFESLSADRTLGQIVRARTLLDEGRYAAARQILEGLDAGGTNGVEVAKLLRRCAGAGTAEDLVAQGRAALAALDYDAADAAAQRAVETGGDSPAAAHLLDAVQRARTVTRGIESARTALAGGNFELSKEFLAQVLQADGSHTFARRLMSDADKGAATREALEAARGAARAGRFDQAGRLLDDLGEVPAPLRALREEVASWLTARRQEAESRAREEERREQERRRRARGGEAQKAVERGIQLFGEGRSTEAIAEWRRALELDPDHLLAAQMLEEIGET